MLLFTCSKLNCYISRFMLPSCCCDLLPINVSILYQIFAVFDVLFRTVFWSVWDQPLKTSSGYSEVKCLHQHSTKHIILYNVIYSLATVSWKTEAMSLIHYSLHREFYLEDYIVWQMAKYSHTTTSLLFKECACQMVVGSWLVTICCTQFYFFQYILE